MYGFIMGSGPRQTKKKKPADMEYKRSCSDTQLFLLMESEAVVIGGKNLTYISKLATSQKKKATSVLVQLCVKKGMFLSSDAAI